MNENHLQENRHWPFSYNYIFRNIFKANQIDEFLKSERRLASVARRGVCRLIS